MSQPTPPPTLPAAAADPEAGALAADPPAARHAPAGRDLRHALWLGSGCFALTLIGLLIALYALGDGQAHATGSDTFAHQVLVALVALTVLLGALFAVLARRAANAHRRLIAHLDALAHTDGLTGIVNRRGLDERLPVEVARADRLGYPLTVAMIDLDHFKRFNDRRGHAAGDTVLRGAAQGWSTQLRPTDLLARYGGEEFTLVLPACDAEQALPMIERLRPLTPERQTFSAGVAQRLPGEEPAELLQRADRALLAAKRAGRNRSMIDAPAQAALPLRVVR